ncbi:NAD(P)H oxidoreductase (plasmid) [Vagococcus lutrae]|uniref:NAD(P)H oxidoreductase n=1 Tax=Vagococcus lutrae TaxID=81947 RepID=UPI00232FF273|nr:NAD(P)H oxidoreductase [Vagococcus lutrae]WCG06123.1 NAD(P)H oxidoreductase [Vagococcus lutrae]
MKILIVVSHPRQDSLTMSVMKEFKKGAIEKGNDVEVLDLYREEFNPVLMETDEPNWEKSNNRYSDKVMKEIERMYEADGLVFIFPVWWYSIPAMMKGYIDRVWQFGYAYGSSHLPHKRIQWIGLVGGDKKGFEKRKYDKLISHYLNIGLSQFVGIKTSKVNLFYDTLSDKFSENNVYQNLLLESYQLGLEYLDFNSEQDKINY